MCTPLAGNSQPHTSAVTLTSARTRPCRVRVRSATDLATELGISQNTVNTYYLCIKRKLGLSSRTAMTRLAIRQGLLEP